MTILITGANGQLGQDFQKLFNGLGREYVASDIINSSNNLDITNLQQLRDFAKDIEIEYIINCAAYNAVDKAEDEWYLAYNINGVGTRNLGLLAKEKDIPIVHYSTDYVFDGEKKSPYFVYDNPNPLSNYGKSKLLGEKYLQSLGINFFLIRTSWVFGLGNINFVKKVIEWSQKNENLKIVEDEVSSPTYTLDLAKVTWDLIETRAFGIYHITNSNYCSRFEWATEILELIGWSGNIEKAKLSDFNLPATRPHFSVLNNFGLKETVDYDLPSWQDALKRFIKEIKRGI